MGAPRRAARPAKYRNTVLVVDGVRFDSLKELRRWGELRMLERAGAIGDLKRQVSFELIPAQKNAAGKVEMPTRYVADFVYMEGGAKVIEDVKSEVTRKLRVYVIKRKLMLQVFGITIQEV